MAIVEPGQRVPEFTLRRGDGAEFTARDLLGQRTVLVFYPFAFSPVCTDQLSIYDSLRDEFAGRGVTVLGVSCDATYSQTAFREKLGITIEQLSDFEPKGEASRAFGVYFPAGFSNRALVLTDEEGIVRWSHVADNPGEMPGANLIFDALDTLEALDA